MSYDVVDLLGRGGSAVVELAVDGDGRRVALKRLALTGSATEIAVARRRFRREAEILGSLAHPGIVPILDLIDDGSDVVLVFPAMTENLSDRVARLGPLPPGEVARIGRVLIEALAAAHRHGVVHRDIKPANVLFDDAGGPALADFGVAISSEHTIGLTQAGSVVGTPMWMAPEQARGEPAGPASDIFSLAATLSFAATGQGPYARGPAASVLRRAARDQIRPVGAGLPAALRRALVRMLDPRPERRPSAAGALGGLDGTLVAPIPHVRRAPLVRRVLGPWPARLLGDPGDLRVRPSPRRRLATLVALVAVVAVVVGVIAIGLSGTGARPAPVASRVPDSRRPNSPVPASRPPVARPPATLCTPLAYLPCGTTAPAPHTNGRTCDPGWYDLDARPADGCEARSDYVAGAALTSNVAERANLVPASARDTFVTRVSGDALYFCWGSLHVTLTAPSHTAEELTLWNGTTKAASALSANGIPATATVHKPSCFGADSEDLRVTVTVVAATAGASAQDFTLSRAGGW